MAIEKFNSVWLGLASYTENDRSLFFGRTSEIEKLKSSIEDGPLCILYGPSGTGKTSLLQAGVFPCLRPRGWLPVSVRLDHSEVAKPYAEQVIEAIRSAAEQSRLQVEEICDSLNKARPETLWEWLHRHTFKNVFNKTISPVLVIDQFEELFTLTSDDGRIDSWFSELADLATNNVPSSVVEEMMESEVDFGFSADEQPWRLVISLREDFLPRLEEKTEQYPVFRQNRMSIAAFGKEQALEVVLGPGREIVTPFIAEKIVNTVGRSMQGRLNKVDPALLSLFCSQLDKRRQEKNLNEITIQILSESGDQILSDFYRQTISKVSPKTVELLEERLLTDAGFRDSWAVEDAERAGVSQGEWQTLVDARLLHVDHRGGMRWLEFSHDILTKVASEDRINRNQKRESEILRRRLRKVVSALLMFVIFVGSSLFLGWFYFYREDVSYYREFVKVWGSPVGIGDQLTKEEVAHRVFSYKLIRNGRYSVIWQSNRKKYTWWPIVKTPVCRVEAIDANYNRTTAHSLDPYIWHRKDVYQMEGFFKKFFQSVEIDYNFIFRDKAVKFAEGLSSTKNRRWTIGRYEKVFENCSAWEYLYDNKLFPVCEKGLDDDSNVLWIMPYLQLNGYSDHLKLGETSVLVHYIREDGFSIRPNNDNTECVRITYDNEGYEKRYDFMSRDGERVRGLWGVDSRLYKYDRIGRVVQIINQNWNGNIYTNAMDLAGCAGCSVTYSDLQKVHKFIDSKGAGRNNVFGWCYKNEKCDRYGNIIEVSFLTQEGLPALYEENMSSVTSKYFFEEGRGMRVDVDFHGIYGGKVSDKKGDAGFSVWFDKTGCIIQSEFNNVNDAFRINSKGDHIIGGVGWGQIVSKYEYTKDWQISKIKYFTRHGSRMTERGVHEVLLTYRDGQCTRVSFYDDKGRKCSPSSKVHNVDFKYDAWGRCVSMSFKGCDGEPVSEFNRHEIRMAYDSKGNLIEEICLDLQKKIISREAYLYEGQKLKQKQYYGKNNVFIYGIEFDYDKLGRISRIAKVGETGELIMHDGSAVVEREYNQRGQSIKESHFDLANKLVINKDGFAVRVSDYDEMGNKIKETFYGTNGELVEYKAEHTGGYASIERKFTNGGVLEYESYKGSDGNLVIPGNSVSQRNVLHGVEYAKIHHKYDEAGNRIRTSFIGTDGSPILINPPIGFIGCEGKCAELRWAYDRAGNIVEISYYGVDGKLMTDGNRRSYAKKTFAYDSCGRMISEIHYGVDGKRCNDYPKCCETRWSYDNERLVRKRSFNVDGRLDSEMVLAVCFSACETNEIHNLFGLKKGDVLCEINGVDVLTALKLNIEGMRIDGVPLVIARRENWQYKFYPILGKVKGNIVLKDLFHREVEWDYDELMKAYNDFRDKEQKKE